VTLITLGCHRNQQWSERELIIYHSYKGLIADITFDGHCISIYDCDIPQGSIDFAVRGYRCHRDIIDVTSLCTEQEFETLDLKFKSSILSTGLSTILWWEGNTNSVICQTTYTHLILDQCPDIIDLKDFLIEHQSIQVIIPAHINRKLKKRIEDVLDMNQITFHDIDRDGYYIRSL
jgi:hypothetical protein